MTKKDKKSDYKKREICKISHEQEINFLSQKNFNDLNADDLALKNENSSQNLKQSPFQFVGEEKAKNETKADLKGSVKVSREEKAEKKELAAKKLAKECFESLNLSDFSEDEKAGILEFFEFRARNVRKSPFSEQTANKLLKQFYRSKMQGINICEVIDRCIANSWVGYEWGEASVLKEQKYKQWYGTKELKSEVKSAVPTWQEIKNAPIGSLLDNDGVPLFANRYDEHDYIIKELMKIDSEGKFYGYNDDEIQKIRILGDKKILRLNGFFSFIRKRQVVDENILKQRHFSLDNTHKIGDFLAKYLNQRH